MDAGLVGKSRITQKHANAQQQSFRVNILHIGMTTVTTRIVQPSISLSGHSVL